MELDFIAELDQTLSNVGTDEVWKRKIGKLELWISPMSVTGQEKVTAAVEKAVPGTNIVGESKRVILSNSICGVNKQDLREYRFSDVPVFESKNRDGKTVKVTLEKYLYAKMANWSSDYLDDVFSVYSDLMETFTRQNLQEVKFENSKDPHIELKELEEKAAALRAQLGLPKLIEKIDEEPTEEEIARAIDEEEATNKGDEDFNPFKTISKNEIPQPKKQREIDPEIRAIDENVSEISRPAYPQSAPPQSAPPIDPRVLHNPNQPPPSPPPQPIMGMPVTLPAKLRQPMPNGQQAKESSPTNPHRATPSVSNEVLTTRQEAPQRPVIDKNQGNVNPRFKQPGR
jgi:hypothetical protein